MRESASSTNLDQKYAKHFLPSTSNMVMPLQKSRPNEIKAFSTNFVHHPEIIYLFKLGNDIPKKPLDPAHVE